MRQWYFKAKRARNGEGWIAWCAKTPLLGEGPMDVDFSEDVYFEFGESKHEALAKLRREVLN